MTMTRAGGGCGLMPWAHQHTHFPPLLEVS
ncbi:hypothetical protein JOM49_005366 [Amycolatopsis magusensis]|uniref:Uncharacterized protein n=1 Tax=Amycolatopsis magusensis TaxID=882444 RepID=A0ABS4PWP4_9PSEU|nr:hypothetical protein [Amycolatopsis magusensis]